MAASMVLHLPFPLPIRPCGPPLCVDATPKTCTTGLTTLCGMPSPTSIHFSCSVCFCLCMFLFQQVSSWALCGRHCLPRPDGHCWEPLFSLEVVAFLCSFHEAFIFSLEPCISPSRYVTFAYFWVPFLLATRPLRHFF